MLFEKKNTAEEFARQVRALYQHRTHNARVSVEVLQRTEMETFPDWVSRGVRESQKNKLARVEAQALIAGRWLRPCSSCGQEPAMDIISDIRAQVLDQRQVMQSGGQEPPEAIPAEIQGVHHLCAACLWKREEVSAFYHDVKRKWDLNAALPSVARLQQKWPHFILTTLAETAQDRFGRHVRTLLPQDFNQIADQSTPRNYIGFIYADGNRMGETIKDLGKNFPGDEEAKQAYTAFSHIVDQATREAAVQAVLDCVHVSDTETSHAANTLFVPAEFVLAEGDDLILVVPANAALDVAARFLTLFQERTKHLQEVWMHQRKLPRPFATEGLTTSAGVVLAHASYPASQLMDLAGELMKLAKRKAADLAKQHRIEGTLDFLVLHTPGSERVKQRRQHEYMYEDKARQLTVWRTERPYTAPALEALLAQIRALKDTDIPRTKLKALYPVLFQGVMQAQFAAQHIKERLMVTGALKGPLHDLVASLPLFPFRANTPHADTLQEWSTLLSEMIELYDFVHLHSPVTPPEVGGPWLTLSIPTP